MTKDEYREYLNSEHWKTVAAERRAKDKNTCWLCGKVGKSFDVHHLTYQRLGDEHINDLITCCHDCHMRLHRVIEFYRECRKELGEKYKEEATALLDKYTLLKADIIAEATYATIGQYGKPSSSLISYIEDELLLNSHFFTMYSHPSLRCYTVAQQKYAKLRKGNKS